MSIGKIKSAHYAECLMSSFQTYTNLLKIADLEVHDATPMDRLFSNGRNVYV